MTYLQLVNSVLRKLREDEVTTVNENDYSKLVGDFVNDAVKFVEASWDWSSLRTDIDITTTNNIKTYPLTDFGIRGELMSLYNVTEKQDLRQRTKAYIKDKHYKDPDNATGKPRYFAFDGTDANNDTQVTLYPTPNDTYVLEANVVLRDTELTDDSDNTKLPTQPIVQLAFAYALRERGETGGQNAMEQGVIANQDLANAIALDAGNNSGELVFNVL
jgi:hypothetical protein